jgi:hypothetical protein
MNIFAARFRSGEPGIPPGRGRGHSEFQFAAARGPDPRYEMNSGDRWLASVRGVRPEYSEYLRRGPVKF